MAFNDPVNSFEFGYPHPKTSGNQVLNIGMIVLHRDYTNSYTKRGGAQANPEDQTFLAEMEIFTLMRTLFRRITTAYLISPS